MSFWNKLLASLSPRARPQFMSEDEIVADMLSKMDDAAKQTWLDQDESTLVMGHMSTGMAIRNHYKLWHSENPYVDLGDAHSDNFPDQMSMRIMKKVYNALRAE